MCKPVRVVKGCLIGLGMLGLVHSNLASAVLVDFEDVVFSDDRPIVTSTTSRGFNFSSGHHHEISVSASGGDIASNGTQFISEEGGSLGTPITMTQVGGGTFSLSSFDAAEVFVVAPSDFPNALLINLAGNLSGGGTVNASFTLDQIIDGTGGLPDFQTFLLPATFMNLVSVVFSGSIPAISNNAGISIDNLNTAAAIPEPSLLWLLGVALTVLGFVRLRAKR